MRTSWAGSPEFPGKKVLKVGRLEVPVFLIAKPSAASAFNIEAAKLECAKLLKAGRCAEIALAGGLVGVYAEKHRKVANWKLDQHKDPFKTRGRNYTINEKVRVEDEETGEVREVLREITIYEQRHVCKLCGQVYHNASNRRGYAPLGVKGWRELGFGGHRQCCPVCLPKLREDLHAVEMDERTRARSGSLKAMGPGCWRR